MILMQKKLDCYIHLQTRGYREMSMPMLGYVSPIPEQQKKINYNNLTQYEVSENKISQ